MLNIIHNSGAIIVDIPNTRYTKTEVDTLTSTSYNKTETGNLLNQKANTSGNYVIPCSLEADVFRCGEIKIINGDDPNALTLTQLRANEHIMDLSTEEPVANKCLKVEGLSYIGSPTTDNLTLYKDTTISRNLDVDQLRQRLQLRHMLIMLGILVLCKWRRDGEAKVFKS